MFFSGRDWETSQGKMNRAKYSEILDEVLRSLEKVLRLGQRLH
jgi:hypothetical protein